MIDSSNAETIDAAKTLLHRLETTEDHPERLEFELRLFLERNKLRLRDLKQSEASLLLVLRNAYKRYALRLLAQVRSMAIPPKKLTAQIEQALAEAKLTPEDIGSSEDEIRKPYRLYHRQCAQRQLKWLKRCYTGLAFENNVRLLERDLQKARCTLDELGSSKEHLAVLKREAIKRGAIKGLQQLTHPGDINLDIWRDNLFVELSRVDLTLEDIGCSMTLFEQKIRKAYAAQAKTLLSSFSSLTKNPEAQLARLEHALRCAECSLEDLGSSDRQVRALMRDVYKRQAKDQLDNLWTAADLNLAQSEFAHTLAAAECDLDDICSPDDFAQALRKAHRYKASILLDELKTVLFKNIDKDPQRYREQLADHLRQAECRLEDLDSSDDALETLMRAAYKRYAEERIRRLWDRYEGEASVQDLRFALEKADCTLKDLGFSETGLTKR